MRYIPILFYSFIFFFVFSQSINAGENTQIEVGNNAFIYSNDEMLNFNVESYLTNNFNDLAPFSETLTHWSGRSSVSPKVLITLIVMRSSAKGSYIGVDNNIPFGVLSDKTGFAEQTEDISMRLSVAFYTAKKAGSSNPAGIAIEGLLSQYNFDSQEFITLFKELFPETSLSEGLAENLEEAPPAGLLQLPYPVGEIWRSGGAHTTNGICDEVDDYPSCASTAIFSSLDFQKRIEGWGSNTSDAIISAAHGGTVVVHSTCSVEIISPNGWSTSYYHLDNVQVVSGQAVSINSPIANYANNLTQATCQGGSSSGPHMHFSLKENGQYITLNDVSLSGYPVHVGRWDYDTDINYYWLMVNGKKHRAWKTLLNPGAEAGPPGAVTLISPNSTISDTTPTYTWNAVNSSTWYYLWVNDSSGNRIKKWYTASQAGCANGSGTCSVTPSTTLANGSAVWWVQTWNNAGYGPWSNSKSFGVNTAVTPPAATLQFPSGTISETAPAYYWDAVPDATWYYLWVNDSTGNRIQQWYTSNQAGCASGNGVCTVSPGTTLAEGNGTWWIQTWDAAGYGPWSSGKSFTVGSSGIADACQQGETPVGNVRLIDGDAVCLQDVSGSGQRQMSFYVSDEDVGKTLEIILSHGSGNGDLLYRYGHRPNNTVYDQISDSPGNEENILVYNVQRSWHYIHVPADTNFSGVTLLARYVQ
jgi:murein DD-endopeptidase MepM/ murein hydrolase activator NlpD